MRLVGIPVCIGDLGNAATATQSLTRTLKPAIQQIRVRGQTMGLTKTANQARRGHPASVHSSRSDTARA